MKDEIFVSVENENNSKSLYKLNLCGKNKIIIIPKGYSLIYPEACSNNKMRGIILDDDIDVLCSRVFENCYFLSTVKLPENVLSIGNDCFKNCICLKNIFLPQKLNFLGDNLFENCTALKEITFFSDLQNLGNNAFLNCRNLSVIRIIGKKKDMCPDVLYKLLSQKKNLEKVNNNNINIIYTKSYNYKKIVEDDFKFLSKTLHEDKLYTLNQSDNSGYSYSQR